MTAKKAIVKAKIENELVELLVKSGVENIYMEDGTTTLASKLATMVADIGERAKSTDVAAQIQAAIDGLINGAPATYDTLKEIADYLATHQDEYTALVQTVAGKVDKVEGKGLSANDFTDAYKAMLDGLGSLASKNSVSEADLDVTLAEKVNAAAEGNHSHANKAVLDGITAEKVEAWDGKPDVYIQASQPTTMKENDIWIQTLE